MGLETSPALGSEPPSILVTPAWNPELSEREKARGQKHGD